ncbi:cell wall synthesis protein CwsA [Mycobacterium sp. SM1]|uniref:cell wall synthesis protein CwsA n=1 Tax=Mycobacterium sp. SM1 TaxID=2816243 RepID=UPI001BCA7F7E|nr:cell wall synthesis protein CwsA [Mycobacterium sp. SM1]MBS4728104.1 cell wall synthesis protein CwsA [Mycobacterium sp. SM1]
MGVKVEERMTPRQRLARGLTYTAVGPLEMTRGVVGLGAHSARAGASTMWRRYRQRKSARDFDAIHETTPPGRAVAQGLATGLPQAVRHPRRSQRRSLRRWVATAAAGMLLVGGAVAFLRVRRSPRPEPSPRPPSVDVQPAP